MKPTWKKYLLYGSVIVGASLLFILEETIRLKNTGFGTKTLWDWMDLLIIPLFLAGGAIFLNRSERGNERQIAADRQQEAALQSYLDRMTELLLKENLRASENEEVRNVARIRTLTVLRGLDANRKALVLLFLKESDLIDRKAIIDLSGAELNGVDLPYANLQRVNLNKANLSGSNLNGANLGGVSLIRADLTEARLNGANFTRAYLRGADFTEAELMQAKFYAADLREADFSAAALYFADFEAALLMGAEFSGAELSEAEISEEQLAMVRTLRGNYARWNKA